MNMDKHSFQFSQTNCPFAASEGTVKMKESNILNPAITDYFSNGKVYSNPTNPYQKSPR